MNFSDDIVMEILTRLPLDTIGKTRTLSKFHEQASHHSYYKKLTADRQLRPILDGFLFQTIKEYGAKNIFSFTSPPRPNSPLFHFSLSFLPGCNPRIRAVAPNGLVLCQTEHPRYHRKHIYTVCKPTTKQWKGIPIPKTRFFTKNTAMFVVCSNPLHFKIIRLSHDKIPSRRPKTVTICEVFDSKLWQWKQFEDDLLDHSLDSRFVDDFHSTAVMAAGSAHWKFNDRISICAFDFHSDTFSRITMPDDIIKEYEDMMKTDIFPRWHTSLVEYRGKLGLMREFDKVGKIELWVMENYHNRTWTKVCELIDSKIPVAFYGFDVSMTRLHNKVKFCSLENDDFSSYEDLESHYFYHWMLFPFSSDFELWNFEPPPRSIKSKAMAKITRKSLLPY